jgi:predicted MFS family arabinose efflux permease
MSCHTAPPPVAPAPVAPAQVAGAPDPRPPRARRIHRAWPIAGVGFLVIVCAGVFTGMPGLLIDPLHSSFGWSRGTIGIAVSTDMALYGLTAPFAAALMERFGIRRVVVCALLAVCAGAVLTTVTTSVWELVLGWGVLVGLGSGAIAMAFGALLAERWFATRRGLVTGALSAATMVGGMACLPALAALTDRAGWRASTLAAAAAALLVAAVSALLLRDRPSDVGLTPYGAEPHGAARAPAPVRPAPVRRALRVLRTAAGTRSFWLVSGTYAVCGASTNGLMMSQFVPAAADHGMPSTTASALLAVMGIGNVAGTIGSGWLTDRADPRVLLAAVYGLRGLSLALLPALLGPDVDAGMLAFAVCFGLLDLATVPPTIALCRRLHGADGTIVFAWANAAHQLGAALAVSAAGMVRDASGSYTPAWLGGAALCALATLLTGRLPGSSSAAP